jgi:hypothetical protein
MKILLFSNPDSKFLRRYNASELWITREAPNRDSWDIQFLMSSNTKGPQKEA